MKRQIKNSKISSSLVKAENKKAFYLKHNFSENLKDNYSRFDLINGEHPWKEIMHDQIVLYPVRELNKGKVTYFNYNLAKEMGLLSQDHPNTMSSKLENKILKTFSLQIINEYDQKNSTPVHPSLVKKNQYMATRYLQLQHNSRTGKTSGDGRGIWNGVIQNNGKIWDISSRGTGVTRLAPGAVEANQCLKTGNDQFGYGCGQMEIDELYATVLSSEIFHYQGINTERVLAVIDLGKGVAIGVRAAPNLIRPAHLFLFLKQNNYDSLKKGLDYFIDRQIKNKDFYLKPGKNKYDQFLDFIVDRFSKFSARLDSDYIFAWLDWDGDNILANAGIIDYGSIRQFGVRHDQYRYDDIERFSTNLNEQKNKTRQLVQTFIQIVDYIKTKTKKNFSEFKSSLYLEKFDKLFDDYFLKNRLFNIGFQQNDIEYIFKNHLQVFIEFEKVFKYFESIKTHRAPEKVPDGINRPAIFNMRDLLRELPAFLLKSGCQTRKDTVTLFQIMIASHATSKDEKFKEIYHRKLLDLQNKYLNLIELCRRRRSKERVLKDIQNRSQIINRSDRATGNAIICVTESILANYKKGLSAQTIQDIIDTYIKSQILLPKKGTADAKELLKRKPKQSKKILFKLIKLTQELKDEI